VVRAPLLTLVVAVALANPAVAYEVAKVADGGAVAGVVKFAGTPPRLQPLSVHRNREVCGEQKAPEALVLGPERGVRGSVILVAGVVRGRKPASEAVLDTSGCVFVGHVVAVMSGERARAKNSDAVLHHTHGFLGKAAVLNLALPGRDQMIDITRRLSRPGVIRVVCDTHSHMSAWLVVHDSPYYAVTDERGAFRIDGIPAGSYKVVMWHEGFRPRGLDRDGRPRYDEPRTLTRDVTIAPGATATVDFELR
jgi:Carboxypeptidase regulatory-like domain